MSDVKNNERVEGVIKFISAESPYGFIIDDISGEDIFFHLSEFKQGVSLSSNQKVQYLIVDAPKGKKAIDCVVINRKD